MLGNLFLLTLLSFIIGPFVSLNRQIGIYFFDIMAVLGTLIFFIEILKRKILYINLAFLIFTFFVIFSLVISLFLIDFENLFRSLLYLGRFAFYFLFSYFSFILFKFRVLEISKFYNYLKISIIFMILGSFWQYLFIRDISFMSVYGFDPHTQRMVGFLLDPNFLGVLSIIFYIFNKRFFNSFFIEYSCLLIVFLTQSRSSIILLSIVIIFFNLTKIPSLIINFIFLSFLLFVNSSLIERVGHLKASNDSSYLRIESWKNAYYLYSFSDLFGVGFNNYKNSLINQNLISPENYNSNSSTFSDSSLLSVLALTGILGLILYIVLFISFIRNYQDLLFIGVLFFGSIFINTLFFPPILLFSFLILNMSEVLD